VPAEPAADEPGSAEPADEPEDPADAEEPGEPEGLAGFELVGEVASWLAQLARLPLATAFAYLPGAGGVGARTREQLALAVCDHERSGYSRWLHTGWLGFLGDREPDDALGPLFTYARSCAEQGRLLDATTLEAVYPRPVVQAVRATVARTHLEGVVGRSFDGLLAQLRGRQRRSLARATALAGVVVASLPVAVPLAAATLGMRAASRLAPGPPAVVTPEPAGSDLAVDLLAEALPIYLRSTTLRTALVWAPVAVSVAVCVEDRSATVTIGRGRVRVDPGILPEAVVIVERDLGEALSLVAGSLAAQLTDAGSLRRS
jgi:hypothetical protein